MITREDPQATGILREHLGDAELRGEVGDGGGRLREPLVPPRRRQVVLQVLSSGLQAGQEVLVLGKLGQSLGTDLAEKSHRVVVDSAPHLRVDRGKQVQGGGMP